MKRRLAVVLLVTGLVTIPVIAGNMTCPTEDSAGCRWLGDKQGNKVGDSFLIFQDGREVRLP